MGKIPKPDLSSPKKNVPEPEIPELKPGDDNFIGFETGLKKYWIGKKSWVYHIGGFNTADKASKLMKQYDDMVVNIQTTGQEVEEILEKQKKDEKSVTREQLQFLSESQIQLSSLGNKCLDIKKEIIMFATEKCLKEADGKPFDSKHLDDDEIPFSRWWSAARDVVSFLLVGDIKAEVTPSTTP